MAKCATDVHVEGFVVAPAGELDDGIERRHCRGSKLSLSIRTLRYRQVVEETSTKNDGPHSAMDLIRPREEPSATDPPRIEAKGDPDRGDRTRGPTCQPAKAKPRPAVLFHVGSREAEDAGQVRRRLVVHSGETCAGQEDLRCELQV